MARFSSLFIAPSPEALRSKKHYQRLTASGVRKRSLWVAPENRDLFSLIQQIDLGKPLGDRVSATKLSRLHEELSKLAEHLRARENPTSLIEAKPTSTSQGELPL